jgi:streptomycin 6-kinase
VLIHGDPHHDDILHAGDRYLAIDPTPMLGDPEFGVLLFIRNTVAEGHAISRERTEGWLAGFPEALGGLL